VAAPERHLSLGKHQDLSLDAQIYNLEQENVAFENISSLLRIYLDRNVLRNISKIDPVKEQIWLFAQKWFSEYYDMLTEPDILKSEFFRTHNDDFLSLLKKMLETNPRKRISFQQALLEWDPANILLKQEKEEKEEQEEQEKEETKAETEEEVKCITPSCQSAISEKTAESLPATSPSLKVSWTPLVLNGFHRAEEHNKTRKNLRN
jgi:serine/threonine protein kinase